MKLCISKIHLGRYRLEMLDDNNQVVNGTDGGSALVQMWVTKWIFEQEHEQYQLDQRRSSDAIGEEAIRSILTEASPSQREALEDIERKRQSRFTKLLQEFKTKPNR